MHRDQWHNNFLFGAFYYALLNATALLACKLKTGIFFGRCYLQPGCLADRLLTGFGQPQINPFKVRQGKVTSLYMPVGGIRAEAWKNPEGYKDGLQPETLADGNWLVKQNQPVSKIETKSDTNLRSLYES
jgi:hypothetical protein